MCESDENNILKVNLKEIAIVNFNNSSSNIIEGENLLKNIKKRKDGRYEGRIQFNKQRYSVFGKTQQECANNLKKLKKGLNGNTFENKKYPTNFNDFCVYWFETYKKGNIVKKSEYLYLLFIKNELSKITCKVKDINIDILQRFINSYPPTRKREFCLIVLRQVVRKAYELDLIQKDYGQFIEKGKIDRKKVHSYTLKEQRIILKNLETDNFSLAIYTLLLTGCRPNELKTITKSNIKKNLLLVEGTKTKNARRWIKISDWLQKELLKQPGEEIFKRWTYDALKKVFLRFKNKIKMEDATLYKFRHTFATNLFYLGVPDKARQSYMGHYSSNLTNNIYTDFDPTITKQDILNLYINLYPEF